MNTSEPSGDGWLDLNTDLELDLHRQMQNQETTIPGLSSMGPTSGHSCTPCDSFDGGLIARIEQGDDHAFAELFSRHRNQLKRMLDRQMDSRLRRREDASDILQQVYIYAHQQIDKYVYEPKMPFFLWLRKLTKQRMIDSHRRHLNAEKRSIKQERTINRRSAAGASASLAIQVAACLASPSQVAMRAELVSQVARALESMDPIDREIIALRHFDELRNCDVAKALGIKEAAASNRYMRALERLRESVQDLSGYVQNEIQ
ncbi:MAG: sigma-70 family RNA polymerase sigma factor [Rubripirellula sp.]|nr:sigma-70 family RNA polymerase sigma factor [Rubripirellula sp.]